MKTYLFLILLLSNTLQSQTTWFSQTSGTPTKLNSIYFVNNLTGYCVGDSGRILKTTNGGSNWISQSIDFITGFPVTIKSVFFLNATSGFAVGGINSANGGVSLKTTNAGTNWISSLGEFQYIMNCVFFTSQTSGYAVGVTISNQGIVYKTINAGNHYSFQYYNSSFRYNSVYFSNINTGYVVGADFSKTTNGGINWTSQGNLGVNEKYDIQFLNDSIGYISCSGGLILKTINQGQTWLTIPVLGISDDFYSLFFTSVNNGYAVGIGSTIVQTIDGGNNWEANFSPSNQTLNSVFFSDANTGYAVGNGGTIIKTTNGGTTFTGINVNLKILMEGMYYPVFNLLSRRDTIKITLREITSPYLKKDSSINVIDSNTFSHIFSFLNTPSGNYYIVVNHLNSIETWSKVGGETLINDGSVYSYDFTTAITKAYGNNLRLKGSKYCIYGGNVNGDAIVDGADLSEVDNASFVGLTGRFLNTDVNGDNYVDAEDVGLVDNNSYNSVIRIRP